MPKRAPFVQCLSRKLLTEPVLFFIGSGLSMNWHLPSGGELAKWLLDKCAEYNLHLDPEVQYVRKEHANNLPLVAEVLARNKCWFVRHLFWTNDLSSKVSLLFRTPEELVGSGDPVAQDILGVPHIVLGRLAKEGLIEEIMTTNYDSLLEAGCLAVGMVPADRSGDIPPQWWTLYDWTEAYRVVSDRWTVLSRMPRRHVFYVYKIHGCGTRLREHLEQYPECPAAACTPDQAAPGCDLTQDLFNVVITYRELLDWRTDGWARDLFMDRVRTHHVVFVGSNAADTVLHAALRAVYEEAWEQSQRQWQSPATGRRWGTGLGPVPFHTGSVPPVGADVAEAAAGTEAGRDGIEAGTEGLAARGGTPSRLKSGERGHGKVLPARIPSRDAMPGYSGKNSVAAKAPQFPDLRAQATELRVNPFIRQVLRTAAGGTLREDVQIWQLTKSEAKQQINRLFHDTYVATMQDLVAGRLRLHGTGWAESVLTAACNNANPTHRERSVLEDAQAVCEVLKGWLYSLPDEVWYDFLPAAVRLSWLLAQPGLFPEDPSFLERVRLPHYYVPLGCNDDLVFPLVAFCVLIHRYTPRQLRPPRWLPGGWVLLPSRELDQKGIVTPLLLPVVASVGRALIRRLTLPRPELRPNERLARLPGIRPVWVQVGGPPSGMAELEMIAGLTGTLGLPPLRFVSLPCYKLLLALRQPQEGMRWCAQLYHLVSGGTDQG